ncbi:MAG: SufS family cysteine desulfurase [Cryomorphaceae bacterium]|nr:SufS family cysteine desulfurase [Cryomorphaceae bacterium]MBL6682157.1 SufS family cysteine desulfurase [Cryomorphaceae bacterium]MBL6867238.1 SufS family cysteine desulfurase [Cryomorphaceae bacterium]
MSYDVQAIRQQFPILHQQVHGRPLVYLDNAATAQKPLAVIEAITNFYTKDNANVHRGVHTLSQRSTDAMEAVRAAVCAHINAREVGEIIFTRGITDSINTVAFGMGALIQPHQNVVITALEHHSNIVPWQMLCERSGAALRYIPMNDKGELDLSTLDALVDENTAIVAFNHISNALGTINPVKSILERAKAVGAWTLVDGAQSGPHAKVDVQDWDVDFFTLSSHKMYGPTGLGVLYGKRERLEALPPYQGGGEMIATVTMEKSTYADIPHKFEAGTPHIEGIIGFGAALSYINSVGIEAIAAHEAALLDYATKTLSTIYGFRIIGTATKKASVISFLVDGTHPYDLGVLLDQQGIAVRTGQHCTQPIMDQFCIAGTARASFAMYNTFEEIDLFKAALERAVTMLR